MNQGWLKYQLKMLQLETLFHNQQNSNQSMQEFCCYILNGFGMTSSSCWMMFG